MTRFVVLFLLASLASPVSLVSAQTDLDLYRELFAEGSRHWAEGRFSEALEQFSQAHEVFPNARSHRALGLVHFELRSFVEAVTHLRRALRDDRRPLSARLRVDPERVLQEASPHVGQYQIITESHAFLEVDGNPLNLVRLIALPPGEHSIRVSASGFDSEVRQLQVEGGEQQTLEIPLTPIVRERDQDPDPELVESPTPITRSVGVGVLVAGGLLTVSGVIAHVLFGNAKDAYDRSVDMNGCLPLEGGNVPDAEMRVECLDFEDRWTRSKPWIFVGYGAGAAAIVTGIILVTRDGGESDESALRCGPYAEVGVTCSARF